MLTAPRLAVAAALVALLGGLGVTGWILTRPASPVITGTQVDLPVPDIALVDQDGRPFHLSSLRGKVVVIYPFLTDCHELCPMTTAAFIQIDRAVKTAGLSDRVALLEVTVDPERDTPARLAAYRELASADWTMLTGTPANLHRLWGFFGVVTERTPAASPALLDWYTHQPDTYDIGHTPALIFLDGAGHERIVLVGTADVGGSLPAPLASMLDVAGHAELAAPSGAWTVQQALDNIGALIGRRIPAT